VLPASRSKNGREHRLPLSTQALALVERRTEASAHLFAQRRNPKRAMRGDTIHTPLREAIQALKVLPFTPHDLRRSTASGIAALGAPRDIVRRVLNHVDSTVTATYDRHDYTPEMRRWLQAWADHLDRLRGVKQSAKKRTPRAAGAAR
jgi:integrase